MRGPSVEACGIDVFATVRGECLDCGINLIVVAAQREA
jgi:hypothetical protein